METKELAAYYFIKMNHNQYFTGVWAHREFPVFLPFLKAMYFEDIHEAELEKEKIGFYLINRMQNCTNGELKSLKVKYKRLAVVQCKDDKDFENTYLKNEEEKI